MPRANQQWVEELDFAIEEWTLGGVRLVEVLGRVHLLKWLPPPFFAATKMRPVARIALPMFSANGCLGPCERASTTASTARFRRL